MLEKLRNLFDSVRRWILSSDNYLKIGNILLVFPTIIIGLFGLFKIFGGEYADEMYKQINMEQFYRIRIGFIEVLSVILLWFNRTSLIGMLLILSLMGGATAAHIITATDGIGTPILIGLFTFIGFSIKRKGLKIKNWF